MPLQPGRDLSLVRSSPQPPLEVPAASPKQCGSLQAAELLQGRCWAPVPQPVLSSQLPGVFLGFVVLFSCSGLRAAPSGPWQLRQVDMFTSKELLLIKHQ